MSTSDESMTRAQRLDLPVYDKTPANNCPWRYDWPMYKDDKITMRIVGKQLQIYLYVLPKTKIAHYLWNTMHALRENTDPISDDATVTTSKLVQAVQEFGDDIRNMV